MALNIGTAHLTLTQQDQKWNGNLELLIVQQSAGQDEKSAIRSPLDLKVSLPQENYEKAREMGLFATAKAAFEPGATLHIGVRDVPSGEIGTMHVHRS